MRAVKSALLASTFLFTSTAVATADVKVVASIKPVHWLVASVMQGVSEPSLLVKGAGSPHTYSLKPSQAKELQAADIVFWMSHDLEAFLENSIESIAKNAKAVSLMDSHGLMKLNFREGGALPLMTMGTMTMETTSMTTTDTISTMTMETTSMLIMMNTTMMR